MKWEKVRKRGWMEMVFWDQTMLVLPNLGHDNMIVKGTYLTPLPCGQQCGGEGMLGGNDNNCGRGNCVIVVAIEQCG